jgi:hypothetical protein
MKPSEIIGKTIRDSYRCGNTATDDKGWLVLEFTDGTRVCVAASYGGYTGGSIDEYPTCISIDTLENNGDLVRLSE